MVRSTMPLREPKALTMPGEVLDRAMASLAEERRGLEALAGEPSADPELDSVPAAVEVYEADHGWIIPSGKFYPCRRGPMGHRLLAAQICKHVLGLPVPADPDKMEDVAGWVRITSSMVDGTIWVHVPRDAQPAAKAAAAEWCLFHKMDPEGVPNLEGFL